MPCSSCGGAQARYAAEDAAARANASTGPDVVYYVDKSDGSTEQFTTLPAAREARRATGGFIRAVRTR
jgi:hypothetical protein